MKTTRDRVKEFRDFDPKMPVVIIAAGLGVSRERVRQLLIELNLPTDLRTPTLCNKCGKKLHGKILKLCWACYVEDYHEHHTMELVCPQCRGFFTREISYIRKQLKGGHRFFCGPSCRSLSTWEKRRVKVR